MPLFLWNFLEYGLSEPGIVFIVQYLKSLQGKLFYGLVTMSTKSGVPVYARKELLEKSDSELLSIWKDFEALDLSMGRFKGTKNDKVVGILNRIDRLKLNASNMNGNHPPSNKP